MRVIHQEELPTISDGDRRILGRLHATATEIRGFTGLEVSLVLPLHVAPNVRTYYGLMVNHSNSSSHVAVAPR